MMQNIMLTVRWLCIGSAVIIHSLLLSMTSMLLLISVERLLVAKSVGQSTNIPLVVHFLKALVAVIAASFLFYSLIGVFFSSTGYTVKGLGACKMGSKATPFLGAVSVGIILIQLLLIISIYCRLLTVTRRVLTSNNYRSSSDGITLTIGVLIAAKVTFWCPIMIAVTLRGVGVKCEACEWIGLLTMSLNVVMNPLLYGATNKEYRGHIRTKLSSISTTVMSYEV